ncbi:MAG TPA: DUF4412 domain-containing protein [Gammaproteobacteria bacterium]|jgi:hypothetical protein|nr:DUF4412 domain-containing protein [Gammaproteobacteria bacterium]
MLRTSILLTAAAFAMPALADTHISYVDDSGQPANQIYVKGSKVRVETGAKESTVSIYDAASNSMVVLMPEQKKYMVFNQQTAAQMGAQVNAAQQQMQAAGAQAQAAASANQAQIDQTNQQMQAAMAQLTPEQKTQMLQMMAAQSAQAKDTLAAAQGGLKVDVKELGTSETVAGHSCRDVQITINGRPTSTDCVISSLAPLGIPGSDLRTLESMHAGMQKLMASMGPMAQSMSGAMSKGFALKTTRQSMQGFKRVDVTDTFKSVSTAGLSGSLFELPAGYTQTSMAELMQPGHH